MTTSEEPEWKRNRLRVPRENGTFLIEPDPEQLIRRLRQRLPRNDALASSSQSIFGRPLRAFADEARADALEAAKNWTEGILKRPAAVFGTDSGPGTEAT